MPLHFYISVAIINAFWLAWCALWFVLALRAKKTVYRQPFRQRAVFIVLGLGAFTLMQLGRQVELPGLPRTLLTETAGIGMCAAGMGWMVWARFVLGGNWSGLVTLKEDHELVQRGPYRVTRHPIYTGLLLAIAGTMLALLPTLLGAGAFVLISAAVLIKLRQEERLMTRQFPEAYPAYRQRVRAALVPFVW